MLSPQVEEWGVVVPPSPTDRRPCCVELPNPTFWQRNLSSLKGNKVHMVQESAASVVGDKHQAGKR